MDPRRSGREEGETQVEFDPWVDMGGGGEATTVVVGHRARRPTPTAAVTKPGRVEEEEKEDDDVGGGWEEEELAEFSPPTVSPPTGCTRVEGSSPILLPCTGSPVFPWVSKAFFVSRLLVRFLHAQLTAFFSSNNGKHKIYGIQLLFIYWNYVMKGTGNTIYYSSSGSKTTIFCHFMLTFL